MTLPTHPEDAFPPLVLDEFKKGGFMYKCRHLEFDKAGGLRLIDTIKSLDAISLSDADRKEVAFGISDLPYLLAVWRQACVENGVDTEDYGTVMLELHRAVHEKMAELLSAHALMP